MHRSLLPLILLALTHTSMAKVFVVGSNVDLQPPQIGTLRAAILAANNSPGPDTIKFALGSGVQTITLTGSLPSITEALAIRGDTQPGFKGQPLIVIDGVNVGSGGVGLTLTDHSGSVIRALNIQRCQTAGVQIFNGSKHQILGNYLGTDQTGTMSRGNAEGIYASTCDDLTIGGSKKGEGNLISGNSGPATYLTACNRVHLYGNRIGTDFAGHSGVTNQGQGIGIVDGIGHRIGGTKPGQGNLCSSNTKGIIINNVTETIVVGNQLGTDLDGKIAVANDIGITIIKSAARVGGNRIGERNIISGNGSHGMEISGVCDLEILGNYIGADRTGKNALGNGGSGIAVLTGSGTVNLGAKKGGGNVIAANGQDGINLQDTNLVQILANRIGVSSKGKPLGNERDGIRLVGTVQSSQIGAPGAGNTIANNGDIGIVVSGSSSFENTISANRIFQNGTRGISLNSNFPLPNDALDSDTGANRSQNYPVISSVKPSGKVTGTLSSGPNNPYRIEFFATDAPSGNGQFQGKKYLGFINVETDGSGDVSFKANLGSPLKGAVIATATDASTGDTSEFSIGPATLQ